MRNRVTAVLALLAIFCPHEAFTASCKGRGTVVFYGNGMFNLHDDADRSKKALELRIHTHRTVGEQGKELKITIAYKRSERLLEQLANVVLQKSIDDFENFWLWLGSLKSTPAWFHEAMMNMAAKQLGVHPTSFTGLDSHFDSYSEYIRYGYNVILVSHSQGNLYANQAMKKFSQYVDANYTDAIDDKILNNRSFPKFFEIFANVQVATPVSATVGGSPWSTFKDDVVIATVRALAGALPANIASAGSAKPPKGDLLGHDFIRAYLRVDESRQKILADVRNTYAKLRYPIPDQPAVMIEHRIDHPKKVKDHLFFYIQASSSDGSNLAGRDEKLPSINTVIGQDFITCYNLPVGNTRITAESIRNDLDGPKQHEFSFQIWPDGGVNRSKEKPLNLKLQAPRGLCAWDIGVIHAQAGVGKEPLAVEVEIYPQPRLRKECI